MSWSLPAVPVAIDYLVGRALQLRRGAAAERGELRSQIAQMKVECAALIGWSERTEAGFLRIGNFAADSYRLLDALGQAGRAIEEASTGELIGGNIQAAHDVATPAFGLLAEAAGAHRQVIAGLDRTALQLASLAHGQHELHTMLRSLGPLATLLSIDGTATALDARGSSETLAEELRKINQRLRDWLDRQADQIAESSSQAARENQELLVALDRHRSQAVEQQEACRQGLRQLGEEQVRLRALAAEIAGLKPVIFGCVGQVVVALQSHDSVRQRIEHCCAALAELAAAVDAELDGPATGPPVIAFVCRVTALEAEQLAGIEESIAGALAGLRDGLTRTMAGLTALVDSLGFRAASGASRDAWHDASGGGASSDSALALLAGTLDRIASLVRSTLDTERELIAPALKRSTATIRSLFSSYRSEIRTIDSDLALSAVNAQIHSARTGAASALDILGAEAGAISRDAKAISARRALEFTTLEGNLSALAEAAQTGSTARGLLGEELLDRSTGIGASLGVAAGELRGRVAAVAGPAGELRQGLAEVQAEIEGIGEAFAVAPTLRRRLLTIARDTARLPLYSHFLPRTEARLADLRSRYTTASERALHDRAARPGPASPLELPSGEEPTNGGSVELF